MNEARLAELLRDAEKAHARHEAETGKRDDWPSWYATYIMKRWNER